MDVLDTRPHARMLDERTADCPVCGSRLRRLANGNLYCDSCELGFEGGGPE